MSFYGTVVDADAFFLTRPDVGQVWATAAADTKQRFMEYATELIDNLNYTGDKNVDTQELEFPRGSDTVVPKAIEQACYLCARELLDGRDPEFEAEHLNDMGATYGNARSRKDASHVSEATAHGIPSEAAWRLIRPYLRDGREVTLSRVS